VDGKSVLKPSEIVGLSDERFDFSSNLYGSALRYWISPRLHDAIRAEMDAQVRRYRMTGLPMGHLCGRNGFHLHPTAFKQIKQHYLAWGVTAVRLTHDPVLTNLRVAFFATVRRTFRALLFRWFAEQARPALLRRGLRSPDRVFGSMVGGRFDEDYLVRILNELHAGTFEITCQPDEEDNLAALEALLSPEVKDVIRERGIEVIRYADL
jgi:predicted glycoside hydrolase/deacetylase ChbG (UPF0249 family)